MTHRQVPSAWRRAISAVTQPSSRRVEVSATSPTRSVGWCLPSARVSPDPTKSMSARRMASRPMATVSRGIAIPAPGSYSATRPSMLPASLVEVSGDEPDDAERVGDADLSVAVGLVHDRVQNSGSGLHGLGQDSVHVGDVEVHADRRKVGDLGAGAVAVF